MNKLNIIVDQFLKLKSDDIFHLFSRQNGAYIDGVEPKRFVYIPGSREDRVLLVAHADTVWGQIPIKTKIVDDTIVSADDTTMCKKAKSNVFEKGVGIGADDRAGVAILWCLKSLGHSVLITSGEETGCVTAKQLNDDTYWSKELNNHNYMIEFDRRGKNDVVFYESGTKSFAEYLNKNTGFVPTSGGFGSDIKYFCKDICATNVSVGYYNEHDKNEFLDLQDWRNSLFVFKNFLSQKQEKFPLIKSELWYSKRNYNNDNHYNYNTKKGNIITESSIIDDDIVITCNICNNEMHEYEFINNKFNCPYCERKDYNGSIYC
jgi:hypothetical protein